MINKYFYTSEKNFSKVIIKNKNINKCWSYLSKKKKKKFRKLNVSILFNI